MENETEGDENRLDLYAVLELTREASAEDIRAAFRRIAARNHPDRNEGDSKAALRFKRANAAFQVLSDPEKKELYDQLTTPIEELPVAPPGQALARADEVRGEPRSPDDSHGRSRRRVRRRVARRGGPIGWAWGLVIGSALLVLGAWVLVPDASVVHAVQPPPSAAEPSWTAAPTGEAHRQDPTRIGDEPVAAAGGNPRERNVDVAPAHAEVSSPMRAVSGDRWAFEVPADWQSAGDASHPVWKAPAGDVSISLAVNAFTGDSAVYFKSLDRKSRTGMVVETESWESESQPDGLQREGRTLRGGAVSARFVEYAVASKGRGYELTCSAPVAAFEAARGVCERVLGSLQIK